MNKGTTVLQTGHIDKAKHIVTVVHQYTAVASPRRGAGHLVVILKKLAKFPERCFGVVFFGTRNDVDGKRLLLSIFESPSTSLANFGY